MHFYHFMTCLDDLVRRLLGILWFNDTPELHYWILNHQRQAAVTDIIVDGLEILEIFGKDFGVKLISHDLL